MIFTPLPASTTPEQLHLVPKSNPIPDPHPFPEFQGEECSSLGLCGHSAFLYLGAPWVRVGVPELLMTEISISGGPGLGFRILCHPQYDKHRL